MTASPLEGRPLWRDRRFVTYWSGQTVSQFGDRVTELALPLIAVVSLHATPTQMGLLTAAVWAPNLVSLFVGAWVDHQRRKRRLLIAADLLRALTLVSIAIAYFLGSLTLGHLFAVALIAGSDDAHAAAALTDVLERVEGDLVQQWRLHVRPRLEAEWMAIASRWNTGVVATPDEIAALDAAVEALLTPLVSRRPKDRPKGARRVRILRYNLPEATDG